MKRSWIGVALLAGSWLFGLGYYHQPDMPLWALCIAAGCAMLIHGRTTEKIALPEAAIAAVLCLPAAVLMPWPFRAMPLLLAAGLLLQAVRLPVRWPERVGRAAAAGAIVLLAQALTFLAYRSLTARSHDLPSLLAKGLAGIARLLGMNAAYDGSNVALFTMRKTHQLAATWELLADPLSLCFLTGGAALLFLLRANSGNRPFRLLLLVLLWLPLRAGLLMAIMIHRALLTEYDTTLRLMNQFWSSGVLIALLAGPVFLAWRAVQLHTEEDASNVTKKANPRRTAAALGLFAAGVCLVCLGVFYDPPGARKGGRVLIDEYHSTWEPTTKPFDTEWYGHDAGYNYACIYDYCSRFYDMGRLTNRIDNTALADCDVLILKVPTSPYAIDEIDTIQRFVENGGGLMLVGEHTDVFLTSTHLNQVARMFGFEFRKDCLFGVDSSFDQHYVPPPVPHPIVQHMPPLDFAVSCSIAPGASFGRAAILSAGLWSLPADYHASNFYPQVEDRADCRYGAFVQLWSLRRGAGRVVAFSDSTIFSNFSTFEPGKAELMLGMIEWLNRNNRFGDPRYWLFLAGAAAVLAGLHLPRHRWNPWLPAAAALFACCLAGVAARTAHRIALPPPEPIRPFTRVVVDRTLSDAPLSDAGFIKAGPEGFGIFDQWILRLGYFTARRSGPDVFDGDLAVFLQPKGRVAPAFRDAMIRYVEAGGKVLILDSALNEDSCAGNLLFPFGITIDDRSDVEGVLEPPEGWPVVPVESARTLTGGTPLATIDGRPVAAVARRGKGAIVAIGFGSRFNDENMGITTDIEPSEDIRQVYDLEFALLRHIVESL